jgi:hypothetical protein
VFTPDCGDNPRNPTWGGNQSFEVALPNEFLRIGAQAGHRLIFSVYDGNSHSPVSQCVVEGGGANSFFTHTQGRLDAEVKMSSAGTTLSLSVVKSTFVDTIANFGMVQQFRSENRLMAMRVSSIDDRKSKTYGGETVYQVFSGIMMKIHNYMHDIDAPNSNWDGDLAPPMARGAGGGRMQHFGTIGAVGSTVGTNPRDNRAGQATMTAATGNGSTRRGGFLSGLFGSRSSSRRGSRGAADDFVNDVSGGKSMPIQQYQQQQQ